MKNFSNKIAILAMLSLFAFLPGLTTAQIRLKAPKLNKIVKTPAKKSSSSSTKSKSTSSSSSSSNKTTLAGEEIPSAAQYSYKSYNTYVDEARKGITDQDKAYAEQKIESASNYLNRVQDKSDAELNLAKELAVIEDLKSQASKLKGEEEEESSEDETVVADEGDKVDAISDKYQPIQYALAKLGGFFDGDDLYYSDLNEGLNSLKGLGLTMKDIQASLSDEDEIAIVGEDGVYSRSQTELILRGLKDLFDTGASEEYDFENIIETDENAAKAARFGAEGNANYAEHAQKVNRHYNAMVALNSFTNGHATTAKYLAKAEGYKKSVNTALNAKFAKYRAGTYHKENGACIAISNVDGVSPTALTKSQTTTDLIIDGKTPISVFIYSDLPEDQMTLPFTFNMVEGGKSYNNSDLVFDQKRAINWGDKTKAYTKFSLIPSPGGKDFKYEPVLLYTESFYNKLADYLSDGEKKTLDFYANGESIKQSVTVKATPDGLSYLKKLADKMVQERVDHVRMGKPMRNDPAMEAKFKAAFLKELPEAKEIVRVVISDSDWRIVRDVLGNPLRMALSSNCAFKDANGKCFFYPGTATRKYLGGGKYATEIFWAIGGFNPLPINCENVFK